MIDDDIDEESLRKRYNEWPEDFPSQKEQEEHDKEEEGGLLDDPLSPPFLLPFIMDDLWE